MVKQNNIGLKENLDEKQLLILNSEMSRKNAKPIVAWLLWFFLGTCGGHSFYLGKIGKGLGYNALGGLSVVFLILILTGEMTFVFMFGFSLFFLVVLLIFDAITMNRAVSKRNDQLERDVISKFNLIGK